MTNEQRTAALAWLSLNAEPGKPLKNSEQKKWEKRLDRSNCTMELPPVTTPRQVRTHKDAATIIVGTTSALLLFLLLWEFEVYRVRPDTPLPTDPPLPTANPSPLPTPNQRPSCP